MQPDNKIYVWQNNKERREKVIDETMIKDYDRRRQDDPNSTGPERRSGENRIPAKGASIELNYLGINFR